MVSTGYVEYRLQVVCMTLKDKLKLNDETYSFNATPVFA